MHTKNNMFTKVSFSISVIFLHLNQFYLAYSMVFWQSKTYQDVPKLDNPQLGKFYWFYNQLVEYNVAEKICLNYNREIVQLPTLQEQIWVNKNLLGRSVCFWTGLKWSSFMNWHWKVRHGNITNPQSRWYQDLIPLLYDVDKAYAKGQYLHGSNGSDVCTVVCQREYSARQSKFGRLFGNRTLGKLIAITPANVFQCASRCLAIAKCATLTVNKLKNMCMFFDNRISKISSNISIDCSLENTTCFAKD